MEIAQNSEVRATYRESAGGRTRSGEILLVGTESVAYRTQEKFPDDVSIIDTMISPPDPHGAARGAPARPGRDRAAGGCDRGSRDQGLEHHPIHPRLGAERRVALRPAMADDGYRAPGCHEERRRLRDEARLPPVDAKGAVVAGRTETSSIDGSMSFAPRRETLPDSFDLSGFSLLRDDKKVEAQPTVGAWRKVIAR